MSIWSPTSRLNAFRAECLEGKGTLWIHHERMHTRRASDAVQRADYFSLVFLRVETTNGRAQGTRKLKLLHRPYGFAAARASRQLHVRRNQNRLYRDCGIGL